MLTSVSKYFFFRNDLKSPPLWPDLKTMTSVTAGKLMLWRQNRTGMKRWNKGKDNRAFLSPCSIMRHERGGWGGKTQRKKWEKKKKQMQKQKERRVSMAEKWLWKEATVGGGRGWGMLAGRGHFRCRGNLSAVCVASAQQCASDSPDPGDRQTPI